MLTCSCPHCGRAGIGYRVQDALAVYTCTRCGGRFTPGTGRPSPAPETLPRRLDPPLAAALDADALPRAR